MLIEEKFMVDNRQKVGSDVGPSKIESERGGHLSTKPDPSKRNPKGGSHLPTMPDPLDDPEEGQHFPSEPDPRQTPEPIGEPTPEDGSLGIEQIA